MADIYRLQCPLQDVEFFAHTRSLNDYRTMRHRALDACNSVLRKAPGRVKEVVKEIKDRIKDTRYVGDTR